MVDRDDFDEFNFHRQIYETIENFVSNFLDEYRDKYDLDNNDEEKIEKYIYQYLGMTSQDINKKIQDAIISYIENKNS